MKNLRQQGRKRRGKGIEEKGENVYYRVIHKGIQKSIIFLKTALSINDYKC
jgi:hypothetical protein